MVRAPCCEKMGMKKGPWTAEEDKILIDYVIRHGHGNWRKLPKLAGLLRCGKSCRLRWINYLRPDIKRGNFSREEEDTIIQMHEMLGNRWSAIAARLPGRTDNEIKNVWHTHLKKRLAKTRTEDRTEERSSSLTTVSSDHRCSSSVSSAVTGDVQNAAKATALELDNDEHNIDDFWSEVLSAENSGQDEEFWQQEKVVGCSTENFEGTEFWYNLLARAELPDGQELLEFDFSPETIF